MVVTENDGLCGEEDEFCLIPSDTMNRIPRIFNEVEHWKNLTTERRHFLSSLMTDKEKSKLDKVSINLSGELPSLAMTFDDFRIKFCEKHDVRIAGDRFFHPNQCQYLCAFNAHYYQINYYFKIFLILFAI